VNFYRAHGLLIASDVALPLPCAAGGTPDLTLHMAESREVPHERPPGARLAEIGRPDRTLFYTLSRDKSVVVLRYPGLCDFVGDSDFSRVAIHLHPGADEGLLPVLIAGALLAVHLMLHHRLVLHASAVQVADRAVAFVGKSGMGKSTLATALCTEEGHPLISDDLLRVDAELLVHPGATETRLRPAARALAGGEGHETADGRLALRPALVATSPLPLAACVIPGPTRSATEVTVKRLGPVAALLRLSSYPRVLGWTDRATMAATFQSLADLVERIPVLEATIPWGLPFAPGVLAELVAAVTPRLGHPVHP
jgi:hypothetical protein